MKKILYFVFIIIVLSNVSYAYSLESASAIAHYEHPELKIIEDSGNNMAIGQGMSENLLHGMALFEEIDGTLYVCVRYNLADNIKDVKFAVQKRGEEDFIAVDHEVVAETADTRDFRFVVPSKDAIVRSEVFVEAMGRSVIFYMDFTDFVEGNTDFKVIGENGSTNLKKSYEAGEKVHINSVSDVVRSNSLGYDHGLLMKGSPELRKILDSSSAKKEATTKDVSKEETVFGPISSAVINGFIMLIVLITFFFMASAFILYVLSKRVREINEVREEALYEED